MTFNIQDKRTALAIVRIFETGRAEGDHSACVVLNDGAGISYGAYQFTHRSGSLAEVADAYLATGCPVGASVIASRIGVLRNTGRASLAAAAADARLRRALRAAGVTSEMRSVQFEVAVRRYLQPAIGFCLKRGFVTPLALAVVYDSIIHGSFQRIAQQVRATAEAAWIREYLMRRDAWLGSVKRLAVTRYRTRFFLAEVRRGNWDLRLPLYVHGVRLTGSIASASDDPVTRPYAATDDITEVPDTDEPETLERGIFDRAEDAVTTVVERTDRVKAMWTAIGGTIWQAAWAVGGWVAGLPREVWIVAAMAAAALALLYLYRQIELGRLRERCPCRDEEA